MFVDASASLPLKWPLLILTLSVLVGCTPQLAFPAKGLPIARLFGVYEADYAVARERLVLNRNQTFYQEVTLKSTGQVDSAKGTWSYDPTDGYVTFHNNFITVLDGFGQLVPDYAHPTPGDSVFPLLFRPFYMSIDSSEEIQYRKT